MNTAAQALAAAALAAAAPAQPESPTAPPEPTPLAGPAVPEARTRTLLAPTMTRGFNRIEGRPEIAAALLLDLDPQTRQALANISDQRMTDLAVLLIDRIDDVRDMTDAINTGDQEAATQRLRTLWNDFDGDQRRLPLLDDLAAVLTEPQLTETRTLANEYLDAWAEAHTDNQNDGEHPLHAADDRLAFELFQREIRRAYDASLRQPRRALEAINDAVGPTPDQRARIRAIVIEHIRSTRLDATPTQRRAVMRRIYDSLDEQRRAKLFDYAMRIALPE